MSDHHEIPKQPKGGLRSPGRRLVLGGIPIAVTLASKPALAMHGECSVSNALSGNLSHPLPQGVNCGLTPESWVKLAGTEQLWNRTGSAPSTAFLAACGSYHTGNTWTCGNQSMLAALQGGLSVSCKIGGNAVTLNAKTFGAQIAAALLNAGCFSPNNYPKPVALVKTLVSTIWASQPANQALAQALLDGAAAQVSSLNINT